MDLDDNADFRRRLVLLAELFDVKLAPTRQALYFEALRDLPFDAVAEALNQATKTCTWFPKPAELRALCMGDAEDRVELAWMAFRAAMQTAGAYASLAVADPALGETIVSVFRGWPEACQIELSPEMWANKRKEFGRVYRVLVARSLVGARYLPGITEQQNAGKREWFKFVPVHLLEGTELRALDVEAADQYRGQLAAQASGFTQIAASMDFEKVIRRMDHSA